ncbi:AAA family ATPase [Dyadobacter subterraneus]|uniref:AAA family ATPase n=1 Tax=Dyadobacter subterraneus TaxID=2773304 RepID=UPI00286DCA50|nr:AAA family ATPase [Dyadobacter subterraneus]
MNVFIGKPNVGKSNILEGIGLLNPKLLNAVSSKKRAVRFEGINELHFDNDQNNNVYVGIEINEGLLYKLDLFKIGKNSQEVVPGIYIVYQDISSIRAKKQGKKSSVLIPMYKLPGLQDITRGTLRFKVVENDFDLITNDFFKSDDGEKLMNDLFSIIKYEFKSDFLFENEKIDNDSLTWDASNLFDIITGIDSLKQKIVELFKNDYGLQFVFSKIDKKFFVQKLVDGYIYQYPYSSVADTFQRFIFYLAAIESNTNSVLIFEEPEVHSFPPYVKELAERIVSKKDNQYFISTHSPYMLQTLVEELDDSELNVILTYYKDFQTHVKVLTAAELREVQDYSIDIFFNLNKFEPNA